MLLLFLACAPVYRFPGPLGSLGQEPAPIVQREPPRSRHRNPFIPGPAAEPDGLAIAGAASQFVGANCLLVDGENYRWDCSGLVEATLATVGLHLEGSGADLLARARDLGVVHHRRRPHIGDIAFFDNTWDRNGNGLLDDPLSHVAIVEDVDGDGTITLVHLSSSSGVARIHMNLFHPDDHDDGHGKILNDYLRRPGRHDSMRTQYLTGQLWCAFASYWKEVDGLASSEP